MDELTDRLERAARSAVDRLRQAVAAEQVSSGSDDAAPAGDVGQDPSGSEDEAPGGGPEAGQPVASGNEADDAVTQQEAHDA